MIKARAAAAAERAAAERRNIDDLSEFVVQVGKAEEVDSWRLAQIEKVRREADERRRKHRVAAGKALAALRSRGEPVESIAYQAGIAVPKVREYLKLADEAADGEQEREASGAPKPAKAAGRSKPLAPDESEPELEQEPVGASAGAPESDHATGAPTRA